MYFKELQQIVKHVDMRVPHDKRITNLSIDSRIITRPQGSVFFAISGINHDGHDYLDEIYNKGVRQFVIEKPNVNLPADCNVLLVKSTIYALQQIAAFHRNQFKLPVVGITGSNGKTIIKEWLTTILEKEHIVAKSPKSYNSQIGVPLSVWQLQERHTIGVFEAGISQRDEMQQLERIIQPTVGIFTNIGSAHSDGFIHQEEKVKEKFKLFKKVETLIYCKDHQLVDAVVKDSKIPNILRWTWQEKRTLPNDILVVYNNGTLSLAYADGFAVTVSPKYTDKASLENLVHCIICAVRLKIALPLILQQTESLDGLQMRLSMKQARNGCYLIDDTYNSDLSALDIALDFLLQQNQRDAKTVILSDILQSGLSDKALYGQVNDMLVSRKINRIIGIGKSISGQADLFKIDGQFYEDVSQFLETLPTFEQEMILIKGARPFHLEKIVGYLALKTHRTVLEVNLEAILYNLNAYRKRLTEDTKIMVMVKALAYGGSYEIANLLQYHGVDYLGVAYADEGVKLRKNGITIPIMVMNITHEDFAVIEKYNLYPEIYSLSILNKFLTYFKGRKAPAIHLKIETGMNRLGFDYEDLGTLEILLDKTVCDVQVAGIFTHLTSSDDLTHDFYTHEQINLFDLSYENLSNKLGYKPLKHAINTSGIVNYPEYQFDMVRLGAGLYGHDATATLDLQVVSTFKTYVSQVKQIKKGESVGYGKSFIAPYDMQIATLAVGYADGYRRSLSNGKGKMNIKGNLVPIIGNICMDMTMVDVTNLDVVHGDEVIIFGENPNIVTLADWMDTIPYEILTSVGDRVKRVFISE